MFLYKYYLHAKIYIQNDLLTIVSDKWQVTVCKWRRFRINVLCNIALVGVTCKWFCGDQELRCIDGTCVSNTRRMDGRKDCPDGKYDEGIYMYVIYISVCPIILYYKTYHTGMHCWHEFECLFYFDFLKIYMNQVQVAINFIKGGW